MFIFDLMMMMMMMMMITRNAFYLFYDLLSAPMSNHSVTCLSNQIYLTTLYRSTIPLRFI